MKREKPKEPSVPVERQETIRQNIVSLLKERTLSVKDISFYVMIPVKDVCEHLEHIQKNKRDYPLLITPARCNKCGFVFRKRTRLKKPGKCPVCKGRLIEEPLFSIKKTP
jgi:predicted Zn-ribbon and HTH transcriptional regulator